jgi:hypothetical protein
VIFREFSLDSSAADRKTVKRIEASTELTQILNDLEADSFDGITTGDELWFQYRYESSAMFVKLPHDVIPKTRKEIGVKKTMFMIFFTNRKLLIAEYLPKGQKYSQDYFISDIFPELERAEMRYKRKKQGGPFYIHMNHSKSYDGRKNQAKFGMKGSYALLIPLFS